MPRSIIAVVVTALLLAACQDGSGASATTPLPDCSGVVDAPTADTMVGAEIDGRAFLVPSTAPVGGLYLDTTRHQFTILANSADDGPLRMLQVWFSSFHGVGTYPIAYGPYGGALYECNGEAQHGFASKSDGTDSARVTAYDSTTGHVEGTFAFLGSPLSISSDTVPVAVTGGVFNGTIRKLAVAPAPDCATTEHVPTPDTLIGAKIDGRPFLAPTAAPEAGIFLDTLSSVSGVKILTVLANMVDDGHPRTLKLWVEGFHGVGAYSIGYNFYTGAIYECDGATAHGFASRFGELGTDSLWVAAFDSVTGQIEGRFGFLGTPLSVSTDPGQVHVTDGTFHGTVRYGPATPMSTCTDYSNVPTSDTLISAEINGRSFLIPRATEWSHVGLYTADQRLTVWGVTRDGGPARVVQVWFSPFHGVGGYSIAYSSYSGGIYQCEGASPYGYWTNFDSADSAWVTSYDSTTGQIQGTFAFNGYALAVDSGTAVVTAGVFQGTVQKLAYPSASPKRGQNPSFGPAGSGSLR